MKKNNDINILDSRVFADATHKNDSRMSESGRSMVEILGVLAVVGVLSVGGIAGYSYAIAKYKASTIMSELNLRAIPLSNVQTQSPSEANTPLTMEMGNTMKSGNEVSAEVSVNPEYFEITVADVEKQACELILQDYTTSAWIAVNGTLYENATAVCSEKENSMTFVYKNDLGERRNCAQKGFFSLDSYKCECSGGTYFDNTAKDCVCPAGHIWSETERKCIVSRCAPGEFESLDGGCVSCEDPNTYDVATDETSQSLCNACPNRVAIRRYCAIKCEDGVSFLSQTGKCISCDDASTSVSLDYSTQQSIDSCNACPNRYASKYSCVTNDKCEIGTFNGVGNAGGTDCFSCDDPTSYLIGVGQDEVICERCPNRSVVKKGNLVYCVKTTCDSDEFMGADDICHKCIDGTVVKVATQTSNDGSITSAECQKCTNRMVTADGNCLISDCPSGTHTKLANGSCYECASDIVFESTQEECEVGCASTGRRWTISWNENYCKPNNCVLGKYLPWAGNSAGCGIGCHGMGDGNYFTGTSDYAREYCEACGNYLAKDGNCYTPDSCNKGSEFRAKANNYDFCTSCDYTEKVQMAGHEKHNEMCASCITTPRFFAMNTDEGYEYCYRCDSSESPVVTTSEERASCTKCPNRQINAEGKCELIKTEE